MNGFSDQLDVMVGKLAAAGLPATRDPGAIPPMVLVDLPTGVSGNHAAWRTEVPVRIVVPPPGNLDAAQALLDMLQVVLVTLGAATFYPTTYVTTGGADVPSYVLTYPTDVPNPYC